MAIRCLRDVEPAAVLYRDLDDKDNAILDADAEREVFLLLGEHDIAARCLGYGPTYRIEEFHEGRTLTRADLSNPEVVKGIAGQLHRFHRLPTDILPDRSFFELLHEKWGRLGREVLIDQRHMFPDDEQSMCDDLLAMLGDETATMVRACLPKSDLAFCHNDTYHGNVMLNPGGGVVLIDFEFSCLNHPAFDFANLFAETVMRHGHREPPHFSIADPEYTRADIERLVGHYLDCGALAGQDRESELARLVQETEEMIMLSDYMYAMAAIPLALNPMQKIRFIPYAHARWNRFLGAYAARFG